MRRNILLFACCFALLCFPSIALAGKAAVAGKNATASSTIPTAAPGTASVAIPYANPNAIPPAPGDIVAEFVGCFYGMGDFYCSFIEPNGNTFTIWLCEGGLGVGACIEMNTTRDIFNPFDSASREIDLGRQMIMGHD